MKELIGVIIWLLLGFLEWWSYRLSVFFIGLHDKVTGSRKKLREWAESGHG